jgi:Fe-S-cluster-containing hydrogenase component 2
MCPKDAILQIGNGLPKIDDSKCVSCGICIDFCPMKAIEK